MSEKILKSAFSLFEVSFIEIKATLGNLSIQYRTSNLDWQLVSYMIFYMFQCQWMLGAGALGQPRGMVWAGRREEGSGWGTHVYLWQIHFDIWQN